MLALLMLAAGTLCACAPAPTPTPTPTAAFGSEDEAFAAAEEVYRAYNDAVNAQRNDESATDPQIYLTGLALESDVNANRVLNQNGIHIDGDGEVTSFNGGTANLGARPGRVTASICLDVSGTRVIDSEGLDVTPPDRLAVVALEVEFVMSDKVRIAKSLDDTDTAC